jgi:hypothetical protein
MMASPCAVVREGCKGVRRRHIHFAVAQSQATGLSCLLSRFLCPWVAVPFPTTQTYHVDQNSSICYNVHPCR